MVSAWGRSGAPPGTVVARCGFWALLAWCLAGPVSGQVTIPPGRHAPTRGVTPGPNEAAGLQVTAGTKAVTFNVTLACQLPPGETVGIRLAEVPAVPNALSPVGPGQLRVTLPLAPGRYHYKYCRNFMDQGADEAFDGGNGTGWREITVGASAGAVWDTIDKWRWWPRDGAVPPLDTAAHRKRVPPPGARPEFQRGVMLPDFWWPNFSSDVPATMVKMRDQSGASWVQYGPVPEITRFYPTPLLVREGWNGTPEAEVLKIIASAKSAGMKVFLNPFVWPGPGVTDSSPKSHSEAWWRSYEQQWRPIMLYYADLAARHGVDMLGFSMWPNLWELSDAEIPVVDALARALLADVRAVYPGLVHVPYNPFGDQSWTNRLNIYGQADVLGLVAFDTWPFKLSDTNQPTVAGMSVVFGAGVDQYFQEGHRRWSKPMVVTQLSASSFDGATTGNPGWESQLYYYEDDPAVPVDLQEQADAYEAMMEIAGRRSWIVGVYSFNYNYWDSLDKAPSIRAKPAEAVLAKWYGWLRDAVCPQASDPAASMTSVSTASLSASVDPRGTPTAAWFEYGPAPGYGSKTTAVSLGAGTGSASLTSPLYGLACATTYRVRGCAGSGGVCDAACSDGIDLMTPPCAGVAAVRLLSPRGGETLASGENATIRWTAEGLAGASPVTLEYLDGDAWQTIATAPPAAGEVSWLVPAIGTATSRIRLVGQAEAGGPVSDESGPLPIARPTAFYTVTPCRIADTRNASSGGPAIEAGETRRFRVIGGACGIPSTARAVALNLTITQPTAQGNVAAAPAASAPAMVSNLNFQAGQTRANNAVVAVGADGAADVTLRPPSGGTAHLVIDVVGYFQ